MRKAPMALPPTAAPGVPVPPTARMAARPFEAPTVALPPSARTVERRIVLRFIEVLPMPAPSTGRGSHHPITVPSSRA